METYPNVTQHLRRKCPKSKLWGQRRCAWSLLRALRESFGFSVAGFQMLRDGGRQPMGKRSARGLWRRTWCFHLSAMEQELESKAPKFRFYSFTFFTLCYTFTTDPLEMNCAKLSLPTLTEPHSKFEEMLIKFHAVRFWLDEVWWGARNIRGLFQIPIISLWGLIKIRACCVWRRMN